MTKTAWNTTQVRYLPKYESLRKAPNRVQMLRVPIHVLNVFAASAFVCLNTDFEKSTMFTSTPVNARAANPSLTETTMQVSQKHLVFIYKITQSMDDVIICIVTAIKFDLDLANDASLFISNFLLHCCHARK